MLWVKAAADDPLHQEAKDILNRSLRLLQKEFKARSDPLANFLHVQKPDFEHSIVVSGYKADAQDFLTDLNARLFKGDFKTGSSQKSFSAQTSESMHLYIDTVVGPGTLGRSGESS